MEDCLGEACGLFGAYDYDGGEIFSSLYWGMISKNHRGHQSYGFVSYDDGFHSESGLGLLPVSDEGSDEGPEELEGSIGIGHVRYATSGERGRLDIQPYIDRTENYKIAIGYNGNLVNNKELRGVGKEI